MNNLYAEVKSYLPSSNNCQRRNSTQLEEILHPTWIALLWQKVTLDIVYMPSCKRYRFHIIARCDLSDWIEAKSLRTLSSQKIADIFERMFFVVMVVLKNR